MSQIFGIGGVHDALELERTLARMASVLRRAEQPPPEIWADATDGIGLGRVPEAGDEPPGAAPCVIDGRFYRGPVLEAESPAAFLLSQAARGAALFSELDGSFTAALYSRPDRRLLIGNDRFSTRTLYWAAFGGRFAFASELKALLAIPGIPLEIDHAALVQCAAFSRILDQRTLVRNVSRLPAAAVLDWRAGAAPQTRRYWRIEDVVARREPLTPARREAMVEAFRDAVKKRAAGSTPVGIALSGGLDSRAIAAVLSAEGIRAAALTTGFARSADQRLAAQVCRIAGLEHHFSELRRETILDYQQALRTAVFVRDGMALVGGFPGHSASQEFCKRFNVVTMMRGHGGENVKLAEAWPFQVTGAVLAMRSVDDLRPHLKRVLSSSPADIDLKRLVPGLTAKSATETLDAAIDDAIGDHAGLTPAEIMSVLYARQNDGMEVPITRNGLRGHADMALPFLDYPWSDLVFATRVEDRRDVGLHIAIMRRYAPLLLRVANSNTGAPVDASPLRSFVTDKANTVLRRLRVPGFRHYHYMEQWLSGFLAEQLRAVILDERTLARGVFSSDCLREIMQRAPSDGRLSRLTNFVMNFEVWCRLFVDGEGLPSSAES